MNHVIFIEMLFEINILAYLQSSEHLLRIRALTIAIPQTRGYTTSILL